MLIIEKNSSKNLQDKLDHDHVGPKMVTILEELFKTIGDAVKDEFKKDLILHVQT